MSKENLVIQQGLIQLIQKEIKEIKQLIKKARKEVKRTGTNNEIMHIKSSTNELGNEVSIVERELFKWKYKSATPESVTFLRELYRTIKEDKKVFIDTFPNV